MFFGSRKAAEGIKHIIKTENFTMKIELTQYGKWLPADTQTPISLYLGLVGDAPGILLESAEVDGRLGRYSLIAWDFRLKLSPVRGKLSVECADSRLAGLASYSGMDFLDGMRAVMKAPAFEGPARSWRSACPYPWALRHIGIRNSRHAGA